MSARGRRGFTLLEVIVVLTLLAITAAAAVPALLGARALSPTQHVVEDVSALIMTTRDAARESGRDATLVIAPTDARYWITRGDSTVTGVLGLGRGMRLSDATPRIVCRFTATAPATVCRVVIIGETTEAVLVDPWSGDVTVERSR